jgi:hypothetical protein
MSDELERSWKEVLMAYLRYYPDICLKGLRKTTKASVVMVGILAEIKVSTSIKQV